MDAERSAVSEMSGRIRELREICGFTAAQMASELGIDEDHYAGYENTGENIPISALYHIANILKVDMSELITGRTPRLDAFCVVPAGKGVNIDRYPGYAFEGLAYKFINKVMEPMIVTVEPQDGDPELVTHGGQELNYVLEGSVLVLFDDKRLLLNEGDSIYFDPVHPHGQKSMNGKRARFLTIITGERSRSASGGRCSDGDVL